MQSLRKKSTRILFVVALACFLAISLSTGFLEYREILLQYSTAMQARINVATSLIREVLFHTDTVALAIQDTPVAQLEQALAGQGIDSYFNYQGDSYYVLDPRGRISIISEKYKEYKGLDFSSMIEMDPKKLNRRQVHHHYQSLLTKRSVVTVQYPLTDGYLLVVERNLDNFTSVMACFDDGLLFQGEQFFVLSAKGRTIYHPNRSLMETRYNLAFDLKKRTRPNAEGLFSFTYQGRKYVAMAERLSEPSNWDVYYTLPASVLHKEVHKRILVQLVFQFVFFLLLLFTLHLIFNRFFSRPVNTIVSALDRSSTGQPLNLRPKMAGGIIEFRSIIEAINTRDIQVAGILERIQTVLNSLDALVYVADMESYEVLFINSYGQKVWGDCVGQKCYQSLQKNDEGPCSFCTNHLLLDNHGQPTGVYVWEFQNTVDGKWYSCRDQAIRWVDDRLVRMEIATDISARKKAEVDLKAEKERLEVTLRSIGDGVMTTDVAGRIISLNKVAEKLCGWRSEEAQGSPSTEVFNIIDEKTGLKCPDPVQRVLELGTVTGLGRQTQLIAKDGTKRFIADSGAPIRDMESRIIGVVLVFRDITHDKKLEEELIRGRKLESVGVLAGGIAHDFNNILSAVLGNIELAGQRISQEDAKTAALLADAQKAVMRAAKLTSQLLTFSKGGEPVREITSLKEIITESAEFVLHGSQVVCKYAFSDQLWMADIDSGQISQVIQNIILNAMHAMPDGGVITIECTNVEDVAADDLIGVDRGDFIRIRIQDSGEGIPQLLLDKVFDPYFTTKQEGSGLGLAICHSIITKHDGHILVESTQGEGTTFYIYLPAVRTAAASAEKTSGGMPPTETARILVMDDDPMIRNLIEQQLISLGHEVVLVEDGEQAIGRYRELLESGKNVDIVIMDLTIPGGIGGQEAARQLLRIAPKAKIIVASGYSNDPVMSNYQQYGFCATLTKPFDLQQLNRTLTAILSPKNNP